MLKSATLPFSLPDGYQGVIQTHGVACLNDRELILEFQHREGILGLIRSGVRQATIPIADIDHATLQQNWFRLVLVLQLKPPDRLEQSSEKLSSGQLTEPPTLDSSDRSCLNLRLNLPRHHRKHALQWVTFLNKGVPCPALH